MQDNIKNFKILFTVFLAVVLEENEFKLVHGVNEYINT